MINSVLVRELGLTYPIFQGGMAWVSDAALASAVSNAGGLGIISAMNLNAEYLRDQIRKCRMMTDKPFGVNIMLMSPFVKDVARVCAEEKPPVVTTGAGLPNLFMKDWLDAGIRVIPVVPSTAMAKLVERAGAYAVIAEGGESSADEADELAASSPADRRGIEISVKPARKDVSSLSLLSGGAPVGHVAGKLGYRSASAFGQMFRRALGRTPRELFWVSGH